MAAHRSCLRLLSVVAVIVALFVVFHATRLNGTRTAVCLTVLTGLVLLLLRSLRQRDGRTHRRLCVLVLGDFGRSPRMQYHALSLSKHAYYVTVVGFLGKTAYRLLHIIDNMIQQEVQEGIST